MNMQKNLLLEELTHYTPFNEQETRDQAVIIQAVKEIENVFFRENLLCHMTASSWIVNPKRNKVLLIYHNIYNSWSWTGGHADGETDLLAVAVKEAQEETGLGRIVPVCRDIFSLEVLTVDGHVKRGGYVPSHLHLNLTYLLEADDRLPLRMKEDENSGVGWFERDKAVEASNEPWFRERIYSKLNQKLLLGDFS